MKLKVCQMESSLALLKEKKKTRCQSSMCYCVVGCVFIVGLYITNEYSSCRYLIQWYLTEDTLQAVWYHCKSDTGAIFESISFVSLLLT